MELPPGELFEGREEEFDKFENLLKNWQRELHPVERFYDEAAPILGNEPHLVELLKQWIPRAFKHVIVEVEKAKAKQDALEQAAFEAQSASPLLRLPREIRDKIWGLVTTNNIIHVSQSIEEQPKRRRANVRRHGYHFHMCTSPKGYSSIACPPGVGDHAQCSTSGDANYGNWRAACKQMLFEMPNVQRDALAKNALQFADLDIAAAFLFGLKEENRERITHLRLAVPYSTMNLKKPSSDECSAMCPWYAICNYFSNPWDRKTLGMKGKHGEPIESLRDLKKPIYFYYSSCYYGHNSYRLYNRWQVGRGGTSWDISISNLVYLGCPRLDIAMANPTNEEQRDTNSRPFSTNFSNLLPWMQALLQFRNYDALGFDFYDPPSGFRVTRQGNREDDGEEVRKQWVKELKDFLRGGPEGVQGPQVCAFFSGRPYGNGEGFYNYG